MIQGNEAATVALPARRKKRRLSKQVDAADIFGGEFRHFDRDTFCTYS
jgi:hypothetical protein